MKNPVLVAVSACVVVFISPFCVADEMDLLIPRGVDPSETVQLPVVPGGAQEGIDIVDDPVAAVEAPVALARHCLGFLNASERDAMRSAFAERFLLRGDVEKAEEIAQHFVGLQRIDYLCRAGGALLRNGDREAAEAVIDTAMEMAIPLDDRLKREVGFLMARRLASVDRDRDAVGWSHLLNLNYRWQQPLVSSWAKNLFPEETRYELRRQALGLARSAHRNLRPHGLAEVGQTFLAEGDRETAGQLAMRSREKLGEITDPFLRPPASIEVARLWGQMGEEEAMAEIINIVLGDIAVNLSGDRQAAAWLLVGRELGRDSLFEAAAEEYWKATARLVRNLVRNGEQRPIRLQGLVLVAALQLPSDEFSDQQREDAGRLVDLFDASFGEASPAATDK